MQRRRRRLLRVLLPLAAGAVLVTAVARVLSQPEGSRAERASAADVFAAHADDLPSPRPVAFTPGRPRLRDPTETVSRWAAVLRPVTAREQPSHAARAVAHVLPETPEGTTNVLLVADSARVAGALWARVRLAILPNNSTGWVPRDALGGYEFVHTRLVVDLERLTATLLADGAVVFRAPVGVGTDASPTPKGDFYVREKLNGFGDPFYGPIAFGTSARSAVLTDWPSGGFVGIHGTNAPELIPGRVSHGCIRLRNDDILRLSQLMPVGTPVTIT